MTGLKPRVDLLEAAINPPEKVNVAGIMTAVHHKANRQHDLRHAGKWTELESYLIEDLRETLQEAQQTRDWFLRISKRPESKNTRHQKSIRSLTFACLIRILDELTSCRRHETMTTERKRYGNDYLDHLDALETDTVQWQLIDEATAILEDTDL
ncbi:hypothetical protein GCM10023116_39040 [Kistimonas scapharcae]|uniref:Uncharacterized protein n=1 Tax=Kistimonas scapharcae TaxID=1036133 RepID=A0ABP8V9D5_9GAMM